MLAGPTTLQAILVSLRMGFQTLAIEKRSSEVWRVLAAVKAEFGRFGEALSAVSRKLEEAQGKIEDATRRSRVVQAKLGAVSEMPAEEAVRLLGAGGNASGEDVVELSLVGSTDPN